MSQQARLQVAQPSPSTKGASDNLVVIDGNVTQLANNPAIKFGANGADTSHDNTVSVSGNITSAGTGIRFINSDRQRDLCEW